MADNKKLEQLKYDDKVRTNSKGKAVLGTLEGPCAEFIAPTRNGRYYSEELWEKVFQNPLVKEQLDCGGIFGELGHPDDRDETDATKIAICMPEAPKKDGNGRLIAKFDILDTPMVGLQKLFVIMVISLALVQGVQEMCQKIMTAMKL